MRRRKFSEACPRRPRMGGLALPVCWMSQLVSLVSIGWGRKSSASSETGVSFMLMPPWPPLRGSGKFGGSWIWSGLTG